MVQRHELGPLHVLDERFRFRQLLEHPQVTGEVISDLALVLRADIRHFQVIDEKVA